jgi:glucokinase
MRPMRYDLVADVGGTHARFARLDAVGAPESARTLSAGEFGGVEGAVREFARLEGIEPGELRGAAVAVAGPVLGDTVELTNVGWRFSIEADRRALGLDRLLVLNDFEALALALPALRARDLTVIREGSAAPRAPRALIGPGTGLGVAGLAWSGERWIALPGEGGHRDLAAADEREWRVVERLAARFGHVSAERAVSGPGLVWIHQAVCELDGMAPEELEPAEVTARAAAGGPAAEAVRPFCGWLGAVAGDLALTLGARGGVYLAGGVLERLGGAFDRQRFLERFQAKGRFDPWLAPLPIWRIDHPHPALLGAAAALASDPLRRG